MTPSPMSRRGQAELIEWFPRVVLLAVAVIVIVVLVSYYSNRDASSADTERAARLYRLYYDGNIFTYTDQQTKRVYPGVVDLQYFTDQRLAGIFVGRSALSGESRVASCLTLTWDDGSAPERTVCDDKATFGHYLPLAQLGAVGAQSATMDNVTLPVAIRDGATLSAGRLNIVIVRSNS